MLDSKFLAGKMLQHHQYSSCHAVFDFGTGRSTKTSYFSMKSASRTKPQSRKSKGKEEGSIFFFFCEVWGEKNKKKREEMGASKCLGGGNCKWGCSSREKGRGTRRENELGLKPFKKSRFFKYYKNAINEKINFFSKNSEKNTVGP